MSRDYFRTGGPFNVERPDPDHIVLGVPIQRDQHGRIARQCPDETCSPGYFKILLGTGIAEVQEVVYCPYCRAAEDPGAFYTEEQLRYMKEALSHEVAHAFQKMLKDACRGGSDTVSFKPGHISQPGRPFEDEVQRGVVCPHCGLDHAVFGLAVWCPDCGKDIVMTHVEAEYAVIRTMLGDVERRREMFGPRVAARDLENCLEDTVSIFEAVLKAFLIRYLRQNGESEDEIQKLLEERIRNGFQNVDKAAEIVRNRMCLELFGGIDAKVVAGLRETFEKRHPITHNLGVVDRKYIERALQGEGEGRDVRVTKEEILAALKTCAAVLENVHNRTFTPDPEPDREQNGETAQ